MVVGVPLRVISVVIDWAEMRDVLARSSRAVAAALVVASMMDRSRMRKGLVGEC